MIHSRAAAFAATVALAAFYSLVSCTTLQDDRLGSTGSAARDRDLFELERAIVLLDVPQPNQATASSSARADAQAARLASIRKTEEKIAELERTDVKDTVFTARLEAWAGRLALAAGNRQEATRRYGRSVALVPGDIPALVLSSRLERDPVKRLATLEKTKTLFPDSGELRVEEGRTAFELGRYREAVVAFDAGFPLLQPAYREAYQSERDSAWSLRDQSASDGARTRAVSSVNAVTWDDVVAVSLERPGFLDFMTAGKEWKTDRAFAALAKSSHIPNGPLAPAKRETTVRRGELAWYLWRTSLERSGASSLANRYSARWAANPSMQSPIPDVSPASPWFDGALGCVEREIMSLPDGRQFFPDAPVSGTELLKALKAAAR